MDELHTLTQTLILSIRILLSYIILVYNACMYINIHAGSTLADRIQKKGKRRKITQEPNPVT